MKLAVVHPTQPDRDQEIDLILSADRVYAGRLEPLVTPVIVTREMRWSEPAKTEELRTEFHLVLEQWRDSLERGDLLAHLSLYANDFRYRDMGLSEWSAWRLNVFESRQLDDVRLDNVMLVADPETPGLFLSRFTQVLATADGPVTTTKRLYWRRSDGSQWRIVAEDSG